MRFQNGDIVKISKSSEYYGMDIKYNPRDIEGEIISTDFNPENPHNIRVKWAGGHYAQFREHDLRLVRRAYEEM